jgi:hypothetical protein
MPAKCGESKLAEVADKASASYGADGGGFTEHAAGP